LISEKYEIGPSICFISFNPVKREVFAADFRDRIVHHFIYNYISPIFEKIFINDCYSCRPQKGTSYGIKRLDHFIRSCSENYSRDCYILKLDIRGYFMTINKTLLCEKIEKGIKNFSGKIDFEVDFLLRLIDKIIFHNPTKNCRIKGKKKIGRVCRNPKVYFSLEKIKGCPSET